jgi:hypothetical protein
MPELNIDISIEIYSKGQFVVLNILRSNFRRNVIAPESN